MTPSPSRFALLEHCGYWARPDVQPPELPAKRLSTRGRGGHKLIELHFDQKGQFDIAATLAELGAADQRWLRAAFGQFLAHAISQAPWKVEVPIAYDPKTDTARFLPAEARDRNYKPFLKPGEIPGTLDAADWESEIEDGAVFSADWKFSEEDSFESTAILGERQVEIGALFLARATGAREVVVMLVKISPSGVEIEQRVFDAAKLDAIADLVANRLGRIPDAEPRPGPHCHELWCPARGACPEVERALMAVLPGEPLTFDIDSPERAAFVRDRVKMLETIVDMGDAAVKAYADAHDGFDLPDGRRYVPADDPVDTIHVTEGAIEVLEKHGVASALESDITKASIERALKAGDPNLKGAGLAAKKDAVVADLMRAGACLRTTKHTYRVVGSRRKGAA